MLQNIRTNTQGTIAKVIIALIAIPFVLTGAETLLSSSGSQKIAKVNGEEITQQQLEEELFLLKRRMLAQMGDNFDPAMLDDNRLRSPALESLIERRVLEQSAHDSGMTVADLELNRMIVQTPEFQEEGRFSSERYTTVLSAAGFTPALYKRLFRSDVLRNQYMAGIAATDFLTAQELAANVQFLYQTRDIRYLTLDVNKELDNITVTDAEIQQYYDEHPQAFTSEEQVVVEYIELKQSDFVVDVSEQEVRTAYDNEVAAFNGGEQRQVSHILRSYSNAEEKQQAEKQLQTVKERLAAGESFADLAGQFSDDTGSKSQGGYLGELQVDAFPEAFVAAANSLAEGQVSDIVDTEAGLHLIRVDQVNKNEPPSFEERRTALLQELKQAKAGPLFWQNVEQLKDMAFNAQGLQQPAESLNLDIKQSPPLGRQGGTGLFGNPAFYQAAFSEAVLQNGYNSDVVELGSDHVLVMHLKEHYPSAVLPLAEVSQQAEAQVKLQKATAAVQEKSRQLQQQLEQGAEIEQLAKEYKLEWQVLLASGRNVGGSAAEVVRHAFSLPVVDDQHRAIDSVTLSNGNISLMTVDNVKAGDVARLDAVELQPMQQFIAQANGMESFQLLQQQLEQNASVKRY